MFTSRLIQIIGSALPLLVAAQNITISQPGYALTPGPLPAPGPSSRADAIAEAFATLGRTTIWKAIANITFEGDTYEPEGIARIGSDRYFVASTEAIQRPVKFANNSIINGTDRSTGSGFAHILVYDSQGKKIAQATYNQPGDPEYHLGGIDYDGENIWGTIAQYRPNTTAKIVSIDPKDLKATTRFHYGDHLGGIVHDTKTKTLYCLNWGARNSSKFTISKHDASHSSEVELLKLTTAEKVVRNPSYFVDYQDCKFLGRPRIFKHRPVMICSGLTDFAFGQSFFQLGGVAILDVETMIPLSEVPITILSARGVIMTQNPMDVDIVNGKLRFYWMPDQHNSTLYVYEAQPDSPYQY